jgi:hypothetical protein
MKKQGEQVIWKNSVKSKSGVVLELQKNKTLVRFSDGLELWISNSLLRSA